LIINTLHASKVFKTPITTFEEKLDRHKISTMPTCLQILSQVKLVEEPSVEPIKKIVPQPIIKNQENLKP
jgi:hypothetical protein